MATYLITGTAKGIGLELTKQLLSLPESEVSQIFAVTRSQPSEALQDVISTSNGRVVSIIASINDLESIKRAADEVRCHVGDRGLDVLVNNAGIAGISPKGKVIDMETEQMEQCFDTNVMGSHRMTSVFFPLLREGREKKVIYISSQLGSVERAENFAMIPTHAYKISKAALHMLCKQYAIQHSKEGFTFLCISPGHLKTELVGGQGDFEVSVGVKEVKRIILEATTMQNGKLMNIHVPGWEMALPGRYDGGELPF